MNPSELIERLNLCTPDNAMQLCDEAADTIDQLSAEVERLKQREQELIADAAKWQSSTLQQNDLYSGAIMERDRLAQRVAELEARAVPGVLGYTITTEDDGVRSPVGTHRVWWVCENGALPGGGQFSARDAAFGHAEFINTRDPVKKAEVVRLTAGRQDGKPYGWHWEIVHKDSGDVVQSGFARDGHPPEGAIKGKPKFEMRVTPVVAATPPHGKDAQGGM